MLHPYKPKGTGQDLDAAELAAAAAAFVKALPAWWDEDHSSERLARRLDQAPAEDLAEPETPSVAAVDVKHAYAAIELSTDYSSYILYVRDSYTDTRFFSCTSQVRLSRTDILALPNVTTLIGTPAGEIVAFYTLLPED